MSLTISSPAFAQGGTIPAIYTCDGEDRSPPLVWSGVPEQTRSLALIMDDPDAPDPQAPKRVFVHWLLYDLPPDSRGLPEGVHAADLPEGTRSGRNDARESGYCSPCPPIGRHRYFFRLFALDAPLGDLHEPVRAGLERAMRSHVIASAELMATCQRAAR